DLHRPVGGTAHLPGAGDRRRGQRRRDAGVVELDDQYERPGDHADQPGRRSRHGGLDADDRRHRRYCSRRLGQRHRQGVRSLGAAAFAACTSPVTYMSLAQGAHSFSVRATDSVGNADGIGATAIWTINSALPNVTLTTPADGMLTNSRTPSFGGYAGTNLA